MDAFLGHKHVIGIAGLYDICVSLNLLDIAELIFNMLVPVILILGYLF